ncbi:uncharacterized protein FYN16_015063 isoform 1-T1 [Cariama cristata]
MSAVTEEVKPEDGKPESEKKIFYCEVCKVPCMSSISLQSHYRGAKHRKKEKALRPKTVYSFLNRIDQRFLKIHICIEKSDGVSPLLREVLHAELTTYWTLKNQHEKDLEKHWSESIF